MGRPEAGTPQSFAFLDQALWKQFRETENPDTFTQSWLALQCRYIDGARSGVVVLGEPDVGPFAPAAFWPEQNQNINQLAAVAERAMKERKGVVLDDSDDSKRIAHPIFVDGQMLGVIALILHNTSQSMRDIMRQLQWGAAWMEVLLRRKQTQHADEDRERAGTVFDILATVLEHKNLRDACNGVVTELAMRLDCDPVSIGFLKRGRSDVKAISHAAQFGEKMNLIREIGNAMDEAIDQEAVVIYPPNEDWEYRVTRAHGELANTHQAGSVVTVPLHANGKVFGALTFERPPGKVFDEATVEICDGVANLLGPVLEEKRDNDRHIVWKLKDAAKTQLQRLFGPHYFGRKLASAIFLLLVIFFASFTQDYRVNSPAVLEGLVQRTIVAPFDGYLASQYARAGNIVKEGEVLAELDDKDLVLERLRWSTSRKQRSTEYDRALADGDRAQASITRAQIEQAEAQVKLLDAQLSRTRITAPFEGIVVTGDLTQSIGAAVQRGQELLKIAPLNAYRVILEVDESDIEDIAIEQGGNLRLASVPEQPLAYTVERITPVAEQAEGRNYFRVEARLHEVSDRVRPGMEGVAKTEVDERLLIRIWTEKLVDWIRLTVWKWLP